MTIKPAPAPTIRPIPDAAAQELLAPPTAAPTQPPPAAPPTESSDAFEQALRDGTIPAFDAIPGEETPEETPPLKTTDEHAAWKALVDFIAKHKDADTVVTVVDPDTFIEGLD